MVVKWVARVHPTGLPAAPLPLVWHLDSRCHRPVIASDVAVGEVTSPHDDVGFSHPVLGFTGAALFNRRLQALLDDLEFGLGHKSRGQVHRRDGPSAGMVI